MSNYNLKIGYTNGWPDREARIQCPYCDENEEDSMLVVLAKDGEITPFVYCPVPGCKGNGKKYKITVTLEEVLKEN